MLPIILIFYLFAHNLNTFVPANAVNATALNTVNVTALNSTSITEITSNTLIANITRNFNGSFGSLVLTNFSLISGNATFSPKSVNSSISSLLVIIGVVNGAPSEIFSLMLQHRFLTLFVLMITDGAALPPPSEFIIPPAGFLARKGFLNFGATFMLLMMASIIGMSIDYIIAYTLGEKVILRHHRLFRIKKRDIRVFERWFKQNGQLAVFISRLVPEIRVLINFPAGFVKMPYKQFLFFSFLGIFLYNYLLMLFGYYVLSESNSIIFVTFIGIFSMLVILICFFVMRIIDKVLGKKKKKTMVKTPAKARTG